MMLLSLPFKLLPLALALLNCPVALAHGSHEQKPLDPNEKDWATRHMQIEHHVENFDARSFFILHDYDSDGIWEESEIRRTYGLEDIDSYSDDPAEQQRKNIPEAEQDKAMDKVFELFDLDEDGEIELQEFLDAYKDGKRLPDFGFGPGHHGDDEYEYEIHHFEKYHTTDSPDSEFTHPEDIRHFQKHEADHRDENSQATLDRLPIIEANIPAKFRRM